MKTKVLECVTCKTEFEKPMNEYRRRVKLGKTDFYCSLSCSGKSPKNLNMIYAASIPTHFKGGENKLVTEEQKLKSSMRDFAKRVRNRKKKFFEELDIEKMIEIWNSQNGKCRFTGVDLVLPHEEKYKSTSHNYKASIDRIDSSNPYTIDNIQFVSYSVNNLKHTMNESEVIEFFNIIKGGIA
jgi:hypothetical protein